MFTAAVFELYCLGKGPTFRPLNEVSQTNVKWTCMDMRKRQVSAKLFLSFRVGQLWGGLMGGDEFLLLDKLWEEPGDHLGVMTETCTASKG